MNPSFTLSSAQITAVTSAIDRPLLVTATPGSGKTSVLLARVAEIQRRTNFEAKIFCISFTNAAAKEISRRLCDPRGVWCGTIHKLAALSAKTKVGTPRQVFEAFEVAEQKFRKEISDHHHLHDDDDTEFAAEASEKPVARIFLALTRYRSGLACPEVFQEVLPRMSDLFDEELKQRGICDVATLLKEATAAISSGGVSEAFVLVDEAQDCDDLQWRFLRKFLGERNGRITVVGDDNQRIFAWKGGARVGNLEIFFTKIFPEAGIVRLGENFRCGEKIVHVGNFFSKIPCVSATGTCGAVVKKLFKSRQNQLEFLADEISKKKFKPAQIAVLARLNVNVHSIVDFLRIRKIPCGPGRPSAKAEKVRNYFRLLNHPDDKEAFFFCLKNPKRGLGQKAEDTLREKIRMRKISDLVSHLRVFASEAATARERKGLSDFADFWSTKISDLRSVADPRKQLRLLGQALGESVDDKIISACLGEDRGGVRVMTVHAAKGGEWPCVFVADLEEDVFPFSLAEVEDERRVMYVAATRAKEVLYLCGSRKISRFLEEVISRGG